MPVTPCSSSSISIAMQFSSPYTRAMPSPIGEHGADLGEVGLDVVLLDALLEDRRDLFGT